MNDVLRKEKKLLYKEIYLDDDVFNISLKDIIKTVEDLSEKYGESAVVNMTGHDRSIELSYKRIETDEEFEARKKDEESIKIYRNKMQERERKNRYNKYLELKKEFDKEIIDGKK